MQKKGSMENTPHEVTQEQLISDFKAVLADAEALLKAMGNGKGADLRSKAEASLRSMRAKIGEAEGNLIEQGTAAARSTDGFVRDNPWSAVGAAAVIGLAIGFLFKRR